MNNKNSWVTTSRLASANAANDQAIFIGLDDNYCYRSLNSSTVAGEVLSAVYQMSIPKNISGIEMMGTIELPLTNKSVIPIIDNTQPVMINTVPAILFRFIV